MAKKTCLFIEYNTLFRLIVILAIRYIVHNLLKKKTSFSKKTKTENYLLIHIIFFTLKVSKNLNENYNVTIFLLYLLNITHKDILYTIKSIPIHYLFIINPLSKV